MSTSHSPESNGLPPLALIAGPTASGKSDLAVRLALALKARGREAVVINADSAQVYADLAVLSARPSPADMRGIEHRLFGAWDGADACSAAEWAEEAKKAVAAAHSRAAVPIVVGGTGLYIRTLLDGIAPVPPIHDTVREAVRAMDTRALYLALFPKGLQFLTLEFKDEWNESQQRLDQCDRKIRTRDFRPRTTSCSS